MTTYAMPGAIADVVGGGSPGRIEATWANAMRDRTVGNFATTSDRDTAIPSPKEGQHAFVTATHTEYVYNGTAWRAHDLAGQSWTPAVAQPGAVTATVTYAKYWRRGSLCEMHFFMSITSSGTANNPIVVSFPAAVTAETAAVNGPAFGIVDVFDASAGFHYHGAVWLVATTAFQMVETTSAANVYMGQTGSALPVGLASGDSIGGYFTFPLA